MSKQLYWEDVAVGNEVSPIPKIATTQMLVQWAGATGDLNPVHYEDTMASEQGQGRAFVHGQLKRAWLVQLMTTWIGDEGILKKLSCQFRAVDWPRHMKTMTEPKDGDTWWCKGTVTKTYVQDDEHLVDCDIWVENAKGDKTTPGKATVSLPSKGS